MELLKNIPIGIDTNNDGILFNLNLFSKGTRANYNDDFPISIVRTTGARIEIINNAFDEFSITNIYLGVLLNSELIEVWTSSHFDNTSNSINLKRDKNYEIAFEGKELVKIFDNHHKEEGVIFLSSEGVIVKSNYFDGDYIEKELNRLNRDTDPEYQNWNVEGYHKLDIKLFGDEISQELKNLFL